MTARLAACLSPQGCVAGAVDSFWGSVSGAISQAAGQMIALVFGWWTTTPSASVDTVALRAAQSYVTTWLAAPVAVVAILAAVTWGVAGSSHGWVRDIARGLLVFSVTAAGSIPVVRVIQEWAQALAAGLLAAVPARDLGERLGAMLPAQGGSPALVAFWAMLALIVGGVQYVVMVFRDGAVLVLTVMVPVAAAGQFNRGSLLWLPKVAGWLLAFVFLKPAAALVYFIGLSVMGQSQGVQASVTGLCIMLTTIAALPVLLRLVTFAVNAAPTGGALGGMATVTGIAATGAQLAATRGLSAAARGTGATGTGGSGTP